MGPRQSNKKRGVNATKTRYVQFLKRKQKEYIATQTISKDSELDGYKMSFISESGQEEIDWKIFFEDYLEQHNDTCFWVGPMLSYFKKEFVAPEKRWLDNIFFEQFANYLQHPYDGELTIDFSSYTQSVLEQKMLSKPPEPAKKPKSLYVKGSNPATDIAQDAHVRSLAEAINKSLHKSDNPFHILIRAFQNIFAKKYREVMKAVGIVAGEDGTARPKMPTKAAAPSATLSGIKQVRQEALVNLEYFIKLIMYSVTLFYRGVLGSEKLSYLRELILNSAMDAVIRGKVYHILFMLLRQEHQVQKAIIDTKISELQHITPQSLEIDPYLCLNETSPLLEVSRGSTPHAKHPGPSPHPIQIRKNASGSNHCEEDKVSINTSVANVDSILAPEAILRQRQVSQPYRAVIEKLKEVARICSPLEKLRCIAGINTILCDCVDSFWQGTNVGSEKLHVDANQYMSILIYVIVKANVPDLYTHVHLASELVGMGARRTYNAYCLTTLLAGLEHILNLEEFPGTTPNGDPKPALQLPSAKLDPCSSRLRTLTMTHDRTNSTSSQGHQQRRNSST
jgi:hypothetical protein